MALIECIARGFIKLSVFVVDSSTSSEASKELGENGVNMEVMKIARLYFGIAPFKSSGTELHAWAQASEL